MIKVVTLFSGYDSQCMALDRLHSNFGNFNYELIAWSEIDKYAIQAHNIIYPQYKDRNLGDICNIDWENVSDFDLLTYSSPCQDFSQAGKQKGGIKDSGTRSSLLWECERAIKAKKPKYLLMENVSALVSKKFIKLFNKWQSTLESYGYTNYAKVLNAKDFEVPQNRERIFMVSIRNDIEHSFYFPKPFRLKSRLKDVLENNVEEKYYAKNSSKDKRLKKLIKEQSKNIPLDDYKFLDTYNQHISDIASCIKVNINTSNLYYISEPKVKIIDNINPSGKGMGRNVYNAQGISPTLTINKGEGIKIFEPKIIQRAHGYNKGREYDICPTIGFSSWQENNLLNINFMVRKLTPRECFRLMDISENNIDKLLYCGISNSQLYKLAGNSIVVNCLYHIFRKLFVDKENDSNELSLF